jgi:hypothetical protein
VCEHTFVTSQGTPHGRFTRAIKQGNLFAAELAARELGGLNLQDALELVDAEPTIDRLVRCVSRVLYDRSRCSSAERKTLCRYPQAVGNLWIRQQGRGQRLEGEPTVPRLADSIPPATWLPLLAGSSRG